VRLEEPVEGRRAGIPGPVAGRAGFRHSDARRLLQRGRIASAWPGQARQSMRRRRQRGSQRRTRAPGSTRRSNV
jgi:hypothetical protein